MFQIIYKGFKHRLEFVYSTFTLHTDCTDYSFLKYKFSSITLSVPLQTCAFLFVVVVVVVVVVAAINESRFR